MIYIIGIIFFVYIVRAGIDEAIYEYKNGKLFKKEKDIAFGRAAYESGHHGEEVESMGCGSFFVIFMLIAIIFFVVTYLGG